jgi:hypothetical protein
MLPRNEQALVILVILGLFGVAAYRVIRWLTGGKRTADPWGEEVDKALDQDDAVPVCHHCLAPQLHQGWFCPECGATAGPYCNYLPYVYIFSQGEVLRAGVTERFRRRPIIVIGYVLFSLSMYAIAAPIYWYFLFRNLRRGDAAEADAPPIAG